MSEIGYLLGIKDAVHSLDQTGSGVIRLGTFKLIELSGASAADRDFIANARQDLPRLLLEVRRLRSLLQSRCAPMDDLESQPMRHVVSGPGHPLSSSI